MKRYAEVSLRLDSPASPRDSVDAIERYLPRNYRVIGTTLKSNVYSGGSVVVEGEDQAGWTLDTYVLPRLASGLIGAREIEVEEARELLYATLAWSLVALPTAT